MAAVLLWFGLSRPARSFAADSPNWVKYEAALEKNKSEQRPLLIFFTTPWCYQCKEMKRRVFQIRDIIATIDEQFWAVEVDIGQEKDLKEKFHINYVPTSLFLDAQGNQIIDARGYTPTGRFRKLLRFVAEGHYKNTSFSDFENK